MDNRFNFSFWLFAWILLDIKESMVQEVIIYRNNGCKGNCKLVKEEWN